MTEEITHYKIDNFFKSDFVQELVKISIIKNQDGSFEVFDIYNISKKFI